MKIGDTFEVNTMVTENNLAKAVGSGDVEVFATPMMIALMEESAAVYMRSYIDEAQTTVGTAISTTHCAATPIGMKVRAVAEVLAVEGKRVDFKVTAYDEAGLIGEGTHSRFIVDRVRFHEKAKAKLAK